MLYRGTRTSDTGEAIHRQSKSSLLRANLLYKKCLRFNVFYSETRTYLRDIVKLMCLKFRWSD